MNILIRTIFAVIFALNAVSVCAQSSSTGPRSQGTSSAQAVESSSRAGEPQNVKPLNNDGSDVNDNAVVDVLQLKDMAITDVLKVLSEKTGLNIIAGQGIAGQVTIYLKNVKLKDVLRIVLESNNLAYSVQDGVIHVMPAAEYERRFGRVFGGDIRTKIRKVLHTDVSEMLTLLNQIKSSTGKVMSDPRSNTLVLMDSPSQIKFMEKLIDEVDVPVTTRVFELSYARAKDVAEKLDAALLSKSGNVKYDEPTNKLIVTDTKQKIQEIAKVIGAFDVKRGQVLIEAKIIQIILSDQQKLGVDWEAVVDKFNNMNIKNNFDILDSADKGGTLSVGTISGDNYEVLLQALNSEGSTNILSSPRITALNGQEAKILVGSSEPYVTSTTTTPSSGPSTIAESVNFIEVGVKLYVTPQIHKDQFITMKLKPEISSVTRTLKTGNNNSIPVVDTSEAETTVTVKDGVTIVIGGLIKEEVISTENRVPLLGSVPVLGHAFRNNDDLKRKTEIVVFLTPRLISGDVPTDQAQP